MKMKIVIEDTCHFEKDDGGMAMIATLTNPEDEQRDEGVFVRFQSWSEWKNHPEVEYFEGKKVRVTIEEI